MPSSVLHGSAVKVLSSGVVKLEDGREGFLPRREFTKIPTRDLRQVVKLGNVFEVIPEEKVFPFARQGTLLRPRPPI